MAVAELYSPSPATGATEEPRNQAAAAAWRAVVGWLGFLVRVLLQVLRGAPSLAQLLAMVGVRHPLLSRPESALPVGAASPPSVTAEVAFMPLPSDDAEGSPQEAPSLERLTVVLDLDETLVCAYESSSLPAAVRNQAIEGGLKCFELECFCMDKEAEGKQKVSRVTVFERPGLHEFLKQASEFADLVLFTAGLEGYAKPLVDRIDLNRRFSSRLYRPATVSTEYREHVKDLSCLSRDLRRTVIVDNNPFSFLLQPSNGIPCVPFSAGLPSDDQLLGVILPLLKHLAGETDVRPVLYNQFRMQEWFQKHGIPQ